MSYIFLSFHFSLNLKNMHKFPCKTFFLTFRPSFCNCFASSWILFKTSSSKINVQVFLMWLPAVGSKVCFLYFTCYPLEISSSVETSADGLGTSGSLSSLTSPHGSFQVVVSLSELLVPFFGSSLSILKDVLYISSNLFRSCTVRIVFRIANHSYCQKQKSCMTVVFKLFNLTDLWLVHNKDSVNCASLNWVRFTWVSLLLSRRSQ